MTLDNSNNAEKPTQIVLKKSTIIWALAAFVVVAFLAALLGGLIAAGQRADAPVAVETSTPEPTETADSELEDIIADILPAGADVRAGSGAPDSNYGSVGDVYINLTNSDVYARRDGGWERVGNIRADSAENLRGDQGEKGLPGSPGDRGKPGQDGTQVVLGSGAPDAGEACAPEGSIFIDTSVSEYYACNGGVWSLFAPPIE